MIVKSFRIGLLAVMVTCLVSCGSSKAELEKRKPDENSVEKVSIAYLRSLYVSTPVLIDKEIEIEGWVISHDGYGQFYKTLIIEDESGGIEIRADRELLCELYKQYRKVIVKCNSLTLGSYGGLLELGVKPDGIVNNVSPIPQDILYATIKPSNDEATRMAPTVLEISELTSRYLSCHVEFENVQFVDEEMGLSWSDLDRDTNRHIVNEYGETLIVRTSRHASFAQDNLPIGSGRIGGVLGYFNGEYQLIPIQSEHALMTSPRFDYPSISEFSD